MSFEDQYPGALDDEDLDDEQDRPFEWRSAADLFAPIEPMRWLVRGVWPDLSYGVIAGAKKTLKSYTAIMLAVAVASGHDYLGEFEVPQPGPVLYLSAEGGADQFAERVQSVAQGYGLSAKERKRLPLIATHDVAELDSPRFRRELTEKLDAVKPRLVVVDSLYNFHPRGVEGGNLYERGRMLAQVSRLTADRAALVLADHFSKLAARGKNDLDLSDVSMSGVAEWADAWILQRHRQPPDVEGGRFWLETAYGSRRGGGMPRDVDMTVPKPGQVGPVTWSIAKSAPRGVDAAIRAKVIQTVNDKPVELTRTDIKGLIGHNKAKVDAEIDALTDVGQLITSVVPYRDAAGRSRTKTVYDVGNLEHVKIKVSLNGRNGQTPDDGQQ